MWEVCFGVEEDGEVEGWVVDCNGLVRTTETWATNLRAWRFLGVELLLMRLQGGV